MSRRRPYEDDEEADGRGRKRRRLSAEPREIEDRLESLIMRVGEKSTSSLESNLEGLAGVLEADLPSYKAKILRILGECVIRMPEKTSIYTTLVGLLNVKNYNFGGEFVELLVKTLREYFKVGLYEDARIAVRFIADLVNCHVVSAGSIIGLLQTLANVSGETGIPQVRADYYVFTVLSALPWVGRELYEKKSNELDHLLRMIEDYISKRHKVHLPSLKVWQATTPHLQEEYLDCLWAQVSKLKSDKWVEHHIVRPYLAFDSVLCEALQHTVPVLNVPPHQDGCSYPFPSVVFRLFDYTDCPEGPVLPGAHSIERFLIEEQLKRIVEQQHLCRKDCAVALLSFPGKHNIPLDYMIVEVLLGELFKLPVPIYLEVCIGSLLLELCKLQPSTMPQVLAQAVELLYERLDTMNVDCIDRFSSWFAYHLSNFQFRWSWDDWSDSLSLDMLHPKPKFISETLNKCLRLSYHARLTDFTPDSFSNLLPKKPEPNFKYAQEQAESLPGTVAAQQLSAALREKCVPEEALLLIKDLPNPLKDDDMSSHNPLKIDVFVQSLLFFASKSYSHSFAAIAKFHSAFQVLSTSEESQICILRSLFELWSSHQQMTVGLINKLLKTKILDCSSVANWLFSKEMAIEFTKTYVWEILHLSIGTMIRFVTNMQKKVADAKNAMKKEECMEYDDDNPKTNDNNEAVTEQMVEDLEEKLEIAQSDLKNLFLIIFQRFIMILTEHIARCEAEGTDFNNFWFRWTLGRLQEVFFQHQEQVFKYVDTFETLLFTNDIDHHILSIFQQFCALKA